MLTGSPPTRDLVLVGGGHAHVEVLRRFGMRPEPRTRVTLISAEVHTPYSGMLPGLIAGHYTAAEAHIDLAPLARFAGARLYHDEVTGIDLTARAVLCRQRPPVSFDVLSIDTGSAPDTGVAGAADYAIPVKPVSSFNHRFAQLLDDVRRRPGARRIGVVGAGAGGAELVMAVRHRLRAELGDAAAAIEFHLVGAGDDILPTHAEGVRRRYRRALEQAGIVVTTGFSVARVTANAIESSSGAHIVLDDVLWTTSAAAPAWPRAAGLATDDAGFIRVADTLEAVAWPGIFAAGDVAVVDRHPRPRSGVFAVRQGPPLSDNLRRSLRGEPLRPFVPQKKFLSLISTGGRHAIASRGAFAVGGAWVWRWKDRIDRRFMARYRDLPAMDEAPADIDDEDLVAAMRCGGCGSKIGAEVLEQALAALAPPARPDVVVGLAEADDAAVVRVPDGHLAVHSVDGFRSFIDDPWMLGRVAATHALSDLYAMGATAQSALALVTLPYARTGMMRADLVQLMSGAMHVLAADDVALVGGHTGEGPELAVAFAVNGHVDAQRIVRKRGAAVGDRLILTRPLGTGALFAAAMRGEAQARWIDAALASMCRSNRDAAEVFVAHATSAMTDITGFGLVGHLVEMLDAGASGAGADIDLGALPFYDGAHALVERRILSSLQQENRRAEQHVSATPEVRASAAYELAFDPQTAGGLLATVPAARADDCVAALHARGYADAVVIGTIVDKAGIRLHGR